MLKPKLYQQIEQANGVQQNEGFTFCFLQGDNRKLNSFGPIIFNRLSESNCVQQNLVLITVAGIIFSILGLGCCLKQIVGEIVTTSISLLNPKNLTKIYFYHIFVELAIKTALETFSENFMYLNLIIS